MSTETTTDQPAPLLGFARFKRSMSDGNYGSTEASISIPFVVDLDNDALTDVNAKVAFIEAKSAVYRELQVETETLGDGTVIEIVKANFKATPAAMPSANATFPPAGQTPSGGAAGVKVFKRLEINGEKVPNPEWLGSQIAAAAASGKGVSNELWDNRRFLPQFGGDGNPKAPWFKDKNGDNAIWPPKGAPETDPAWRHPLAQTDSYEEPF